MPLSRKDPWPIPITSNRPVPAEPAQHTATDIRPNVTRDVIMRAVETHFALYGKCPTFREICRYTGITSFAVLQHHFKVLLQYGYLSEGKKVHHKGRYYRLTKLRYFEQ